MEGLSFSNFGRSFDDDGDGTWLTRESVDAIETSHMSLEQKNVETFDEMRAAEEKAIWRVLCSHLEDNVILWVPFHKSNSIWSFYLLAHANCALMSQQHKW
jgi:GH43 family beta-xylosidase